MNSWNDDDECMNFWNHEDDHKIKFEPVHEISNNVAF